MDRENECSTSFIKMETITILAITFNVNAKHGEQAHVNSLLKLRLQGYKPDVVFVGFQEMVALSTTNVVGSAILGNQIVIESVDKWSSLILQALNGTSTSHKEGSTIGEQYEIMATCAMVGTMIVGCVLKERRHQFTNVRTGTVARGVGHVLGNKGAVCLRFELEDTSVCIVNAHFSAHREAYLKRNEDFSGILSSKIFRIEEPVEAADKYPTSTRPASIPSEVQLKRDLSTLRQRLVSSNGSSTTESQELATGDATAVSAARGGALEDRGAVPTPVVFPTLAEEMAASTLLSPDDHDVILWIGDLNYRISSELDMGEVYRLIDCNDIAKLTTYDQLMEQRDTGAVFEGFKEGLISFPPTYQFISGTNEYDRREGGKNRCPAWCDRILWRVGQGLQRIATALKAEDSIDASSVVIAPTEERLEWILHKLFDGNVSADAVKVRAFLRDQLQGMSADLCSSSALEKSAALSVQATLPSTHEATTTTDAISLNTLNMSAAVGVTNTDATDEIDGEYDDDGDDGSDRRDNVHPSEVHNFRSEYVRLFLTAIQDSLVHEKVDLILYESCPTVLISDHLPVRALFQLQYKRVNWRERKAILASVFDQMAAQCDPKRVVENQGLNEGGSTVDSTSVTTDPWLASTPAVELTTVTATSMPNSMPPTSGALLNLHLSTALSASHSSDCYSLLFGALSLLRAEPDHLLFPVNLLGSGAVHDHRSTSISENLYADVTSKTLTLTAVGDLEFAVLPSSVPDWLTVRPNRGTIVRGQTTSLAISLVLHDSPTDSSTQSLLAFPYPDTNEHQDSEATEVRAAATQESESDIFERGNTEYNGGSGADERDTEDDSASEEAAFASFSLADPSSIPHSILDHGTASPIAGSRLSVRRRPSVATPDSKFSQFLIQSKLSGRYSAGKDPAEGCIDDAATSLLIQYRLIDSSLLWNSIVIPVACIILG